MRTIAASVFLSACLHTACRDPQTGRADPQIVWRTLGSWSGRGNTQTESFTSDTGSMRIDWATANEAAPGSGRFRLTIHSAISGRPLQEAVDQQGPGKATAYVHEDPRVFYAVVEAANLDWSVTIDEAVLVEPKQP
jgi:hypothetical protein